MRYMLLIYQDEQALDEIERAECYRESTELARELHAAGQYLAAAPLHPTFTATSVRVRDGKRLVTDGPFAETREQLGGYFLIDAGNLDEAIAVASRIPMARKGTVEVRPVIEIAGLPAMSIDGLADQDIVIERVFDAPRDLVFKAWTEPERVMQWWGPKGFTSPACTIDLRPGGVWHSAMRSPDGQDFWSKGVYREVVPPARLVTTDQFSDAQGNVVEPTQYGMSAEWPREALITLAFDDLAGKTKLTVRHAVGSAPAKEREMCEQGWSESLDKLADYLAAVQP